MAKISVTHINNSHSDWMRAMDFYKGEITLLKKRLTEIAGKNSNRDVLKEVEHYENQFEIQLNNINKIRHELKSNAHNIAKEAEESSAGYIDSGLAEQHQEMHQRCVAEEKTINELRHDFNDFATIWM